MQMNQLGRSGLYLSEFGLGAMTFGMPEWGCDEDTSAALVHRYLDAGGNFIDTADIYGAAGASEEFTGRALKGRRDQVVIATKVGLPSGTGPHERGTGRIHVRQACETSLRRLGTDYIDLYQIHIDDDGTTLDETISALDDLVREGKVLYVGASNFHAYRLMKALAISDRLGAARFVSFQGQYNLIVRTLEREHMGLLAEEGLGLVTYAPLAGGMLTGKVSPEAPPEGTRHDHLQNPVTALQRNPRGFEIVEVVKATAAEIGCTPAQLALAWVRTRPVTSVIVGARTMAQLDDNLAALDVVIPPELVERLDQASQPGPEYPGAFIDFVRRGLTRSQGVARIFDAK